MAKTSQVTQRTAPASSKSVESKPSYEAQLQAARFAVEVATQRLEEANKAVVKAKANAHVDRQPAIDAAVAGAMVASIELTDAVNAFSTLDRQARKSAHAY